jgi:hypothetical protein
MWRCVKGYRNKAGKPSFQNIQLLTTIRYSKMVFVVFQLFSPHGRTSWERKVEQ